MLDQNAKIVAINFDSVDLAEDMTNKSTHTNKEKRELDFTGKSKKFTLDRANAQLLKQAYTKLNIAKEPSSKNVFLHTGLYADGHIWHIPFFAELEYGESYLVCQVLNLYTHTTSQSKSFRWMKIQIFKQENESLGIIPLKASNIKYLKTNSYFILKCNIQVIQQGSSFFLNTWAKK